MVYCSGVATGGEAEWEFVWSQFKNASVASEAQKLMSALSCTNSTQLLRRWASFKPGSRLKPQLDPALLTSCLLCLHRYLSYTLNSTMIRKQDASAVITAVAANRAGQDLAWDFIRDQWDYMSTQ